MRSQQNTKLGTSGDSAASVTLIVGEVVKRRGFFDSAVEMPKGGPPRSSPPNDSLDEIAVNENIVAVSIQSTALREAVKAALGDFAVVDDLGVDHAAVVIADLRSNVAEEIGVLRARVRRDSALLFVLPTTTLTDAMISDAHAAGAYACVRSPLVPSELANFVRMALDSRAAKGRVADLTRQLDLEAHLASIGRISAGLSHELSTPLLVASMNLETIRQESTRLCEMMAHRGVSTSVDRDGLLSAIEDAQQAHDRLRSILDMMRGLVGRRRVNQHERIDLMAAVAETQRLLADQLAGVEVTLIGSPTHVVADSVLIGQILQNLITNAVTAARMLSSPRIRLHVYTYGKSAIVSVRDNGPGIAPDQHHRIFEPFYTTRRGHGGMGLGLALCREYALQMKAEISLWSMPGRGACFRVIFPSAPDSH